MGIRCETGGTVRTGQDRVIVCIRCKALLPAYYLPTCLPGFEARDEMVGGGVSTPVSREQLRRGNGRCIGEPVELADPLTLT